MKKLLLSVLYYLPLVISAQSFSGFNSDSTGIAFGKIYPEKNKFPNLEIQQQLAIFHQVVRQFRQASGRRSFHLVEIACVDFFVEILNAIFGFIWEV